MKRYKHILCVAEPDKVSKQALLRAVALVKNNRSGLTVMGVTPAPRVTTGIGMCVSRTGMPGFVTPVTLEG